jgi:hypothetical protein
VLLIHPWVQGQPLKWTVLLVKPVTTEVDSVVDQVLGYWSNKRLVPPPELTPEKTKNTISQRESNLKEKVKEFHGPHHVSAEGDNM